MTFNQIGNESMRMSSLEGRIIPAPDVADSIVELLNMLSTLEKSYDNKLILQAFKNILPALRYTSSGGRQGVMLSNSCLCAILSLFDFWPFAFQ